MYVVTEQFRKEAYALVQSEIKALGLTTVISPTYETVELYNDITGRISTSGNSLYTCVNSLRARRTMHLAETQEIALPTPASSFDANGSEVL